MRTAMRGVRACPSDEYLWTIAAARLILPSDVHLQAPPNLSDDFGSLLAAGVDDWGGVSPVTADLVLELLGAGLVVIGKTHTVEFAMGSFGTNQHLGTPWNPWDPEIHRAPGGSSAGSAVAVVMLVASAMLSGIQIASWTRLGGRVRGRRRCGRRRCRPRGPGACRTAVGRCAGAGWRRRCRPGSFRRSRWFLR